MKRPTIDCLRWAAGHLAMAFPGVLTALLPLVLLASCSTTKNIPDDDQLFVGLTKIDYQKYQPSTHFDNTQAEIEAALATAPNGALFGSSYYRSPIQYRLWIWNYANGSHGRFKQWLNRSFGKAPVLMSQVNPTLRASVVQSVLRNNGYMHGSVKFHEVPQKNKKKMKIGYTVVLDTLFTVDSLEYVHFPEPMQQLIDSTRAEQVLTPGSPFAVAGLDSERNRVYRLMRNNGYYYFQPGYSSYLADTLMVPNHAQLRLQLADSLPEESLRQWYIGNRTFTLRRSAMEARTASGAMNTDTLMVRRRRGGTVPMAFINYYGKSSPVSTRVLMRNMRLRRGRAYSYDAYTESVQKLNSTGVFSSVDFQFTPRAASAGDSASLSADTLDLAVTMTLDKPYDFYVETNFVNRTIGRFGPELKVGFTRRNLFRSAEKLDINLHGSYEWQTSSSDNNMNSYQYGVDGSVEFPYIIAPFVGEGLGSDRPRRRRRPRRFYSTPWTILKASTDIIHRPNYYKMHIVSGELTYRWQTAETMRHEFSPLTVKYQFMNSHTAKFDELAMSNPYIMVSMGDYFIPKMRYTFTYASKSARLNPIRWETTLEESGNVSSLYFLSRGEKWSEKNKKMFKNPYSQFLKIETDFTKTWRLGSAAQLVGHLNAGYIYSYGNSDSEPFSETFYVGGANSIRAFTVRSIGPGAFPGLGSRQMSYMLQNGNVKFVANLEYRTHLFGSLYGAVFLDGGNVWSTADWKLDYDENRSEEDTEFVDAWNMAFTDTKFIAKKFFRELATGTGVGLRYDLDFLILRVDWGFGLHLPYDTGKSGYFNIPRFKDMHTLHVAIGYPF